MALTTIEAVEEALGRELTPEEAVTVQTSIDSLTSFVESYTGSYFTEHVDENIRLQADAAGLIDFEFGPVTDVSNIYYPQGTDTVLYAYWDYLETIYNLKPHQVVDVVMTYGYETVPDDMAAYALQMVLNEFNGVSGGPLESYRVGDVTETYGTGGKGASTPQTYQTLGNSVLESYRRTETSWRLGARKFPGPAFEIL